VNRSRATVVVIMSACCLFLGAAVPAQIPATRLEGSVQNVTGAPISGAAVTAVDDRTGRRMQTMTDSEGRYVFPALPPGIYTLWAEAKDFQTLVHPNIVLGVSACVIESFVLEPFSSTEPVREESPRERVLNSETQFSGAFAGHDIRVLPLADRIPGVLAAFQPGVPLRAGDEGSSQVNGTRRSSNNVNLDGMDVNDPVDPRLGLSLAATNPDSIGHILVITAGAPAEYGRNAGGQVMLTTRPGTARWSGSAFEYFRDRSLDANGFFNNAAGITRPRFTQNLFGGSLGGPVTKGGTLLFANYQGRRTTREIVRNRTVPTPEAKSGLFRWTPPSSSTTSSFDIVANDPRRLGIDPKVAAALALLPDPNNTDTGDGLNTGGYRFKNPDNSDEHQFTIRVDRDLSRANRMFARFSWNRATAVDSAGDADARYPGQPQGKIDARNWGFSAGSDWSVSALTVNQVRAGYQSAQSDRRRPARLAGPMMIANSWTDPLDPSFPRSQSSQVAQVADHLAWIRGKHAFKAGFTFRYVRQGGRDEAGIYPDVTFGTAYGNAPPISIGPSGSSISKADRLRFEKLYNDLLGRMEQASQTFYGNLERFLPAGTARERHFVFREYGAFAQDDWKLRSNLTLNLGVRFEYAGAPREKSGIFAALDRAGDITSSAGIADLRLVPGAAWYKKDLNNFGPRLGFAWSPWGSTRMVLRGGYGIFFDRLAGTATNFADSNTPGSSHVVAVFPNLAGTDLRLRDGVPSLPQPAAPELRLPATRSTPAAVFRPDLRTPYVQHFALLLQREVFANTIAEAGYVGERGVDLFMNLNLNQLKIGGDFLQAFQELQSFRSSGTPVPSTNTLARIFGSVNAAVSAIGGSVLDLGLAGAAADTVDRNHFRLYPAAGVSDFYLRNFPQFSQLIVGTNEGRSYYDSLQFRLRRDSGPLKVHASYTWSKSQDNLSTGAGPVPLESFRPAANKALSDADRPHAFSTWLVYSLPPLDPEEASGDIGWLTRFASGWDIGVLGVWESGARFSVSSGRRMARADVDSLADYTGDRRVRDVKRKSEGVFWFSESQIKAFSVPAAGAIGNSGLNSFLGPKYLNIDLSLMRSFRVRGENRLHFRAEIYNIFNRTNFGLPGATLSDSSNFGRISSLQGYPRRIQAALRYEF